MTKIEWVKNKDGSQGQSWNPIVGCSLASPGCANCYAMKMAARLERMGHAHYAGLTQPSKAGPVWTGKVALAPESVLLAPLKRKKPTTYFVNSMGDLFHEDVPGELIDRVFAVMALCPQHTFQVLTKRAKRMSGYAASLLGRYRLDALDGLINAAAEIGGVLAGAEIGVRPFPLPNVWLGASAEDQRRYDERKEHLQATPATVKFFSFEPLLGNIETDYLADWVIVGGESGKGAQAVRPMSLEWAQSLRDQCFAAGVPFFFKQWGECDSREIRVGKQRAGCLLDGREHKEMPSCA